VGRAFLSIVAIAALAGGSGIASAGDVRSYAPGDPILLRSGGCLFWPGTVEAIGTVEDDTVGSYLVKSTTGTWWEWQTDIYPAERDPIWTATYLGDWDISIPMAMTTRIEGDMKVTTLSSGMKLPPLHIDPDGSYSWLEDDGTLIEGRWIPAGDTPGVILQNGVAGADWTLCITSDPSSVEILGSDELTLQSPDEVSLHGQRIEGDG
jgi:hypothetical protein